MAQNKKLRIAIIGAGYFSQFHYQAWSRQKNVELVAICDRDLSAANTRAKAYNVKHVFSELNQMLSEVEFDLVDVITPPETHFEYVSLCLRAGCDVICQKPFTQDIQQAQSLISIAKSCQKQLIIHENFRFMPWYRKLKMELQQGRIGDVLNIQFRLRPGDGQGAYAYLNRQPYFQQMSRFLIHETAIHFIDTFRYLLGEVSDVSARLRQCNPHIAGEDAGVVIFGFASGAVGVFDGNRCIDHSAENHRLTMGEMLIEGTQGCLRLDGQANIWRRKMGEVTESKVAYNWNNEGFGGDCVYHLISHVVKHFVDGEKLENTAEEYLRNIQIEQAIYDSHEQRKVCDLPSLN